MEGSECKFRSRDEGSRSRTGGQGFTAENTENTKDKNPARALLRRTIRELDR
jgi:hypothetical protein